MTMDDVIQYTQSVLLGFIVSFLLAKLFSVVFSSGDETAAKPNENLPDETRRKSVEKDKRTDAEFSKKIAGNDSDDDWEGVEATELDAAFCAATAFVAAAAADRSAQKVSNDVRLKLYGLYKIVTDGVCCVPQPSAIKITARAKWKAWNKLGDMSPEEAMQKYLEIITELYPTWADGSTSKRRGGDNNETSSKDTRPMGPDFSSFVHEEEFKLDAIHDFATEDQKPLHSAFDHDQTDVAEMPLSRNADINLKDNEGQTVPLHHAAAYDDTGVKKNAATGIHDDDDNDGGGGDDGTVYTSDLSDSNWHSIEP